MRRADIDNGDAVALYQAGWTTVELGARYRVSPNTVRNLLLRRGVELRTPAQSLPTYTVETADEIVRLYRTGRLNRQEVARRVGVTDHIVRAVLAKRGVPTRPKFQPPEVEPVTDPATARRLASIIDRRGRFYDDPLRVAANVTTHDMRFLLEHAGGRWNRRARCWELSRTVDIETVLAAVLPHLAVREREAGHLLAVVRARIDGQEPGHGSER